MESLLYYYKKLNLLLIILQKAYLGKKLIFTKTKNAPTVKKAIVEKVLQKAVCEDDTLQLE